MTEKKTKTNHSDFIIGMDAYYPNTRVVNGVQQKEGEYAGGFVTVGKVELYDIEGRMLNGHVKSEEQVRQTANVFWKTRYQGFMKQMWIKKDGQTIAFHGNFENKQIRRNVYRKVWVKK